MMNITPIEFANFDLVEVKTTNESRPTPHCKIHGAMNKITPEGIWRCITATGFKDVVQGNSKSKVSLGQVLHDNDIMINTVCNSLDGNEVYYALEDIIFNTQFELYLLIKIYLNNESNN